MDELAGRAHDQVSETAAGTPAGAPEGVREAVVPLPTASPAFPGWDAAGDSRRSQKASLPDELRPRNRLFAAGAEALSSAELLAVLFSAFPGTGDAAAMELAGRLISEGGSARSAAFHGPRAGGRPRGGRGKGLGPPGRRGARQAHGFPAHPRPTRNLLPGRRPTSTPRATSPTTAPGTRSGPAKARRAARTAASRASSRTSTPSLWPPRGTSWRPSVASGTSWSGSETWGRRGAD